MINTAEFVLAFFPNPLYAAKAEAVFQAMGIGCRTIAPGEVSQSVGYLAGLPGQAATPKPLTPPALAEAMLVLCALSPARMDQLFATMRAAGVPAPNRKAVLTPTNLGWSFAALYDELGREHEAIHRGGK